MNTALTPSELGLLDRHYHSRTGAIAPSRGPAPAWKRQVESKASSYHSFTPGGIWRDKVRRGDRHPMAQASKGQRDAFGNRKREKNPELKARAYLQHVSVVDPELAKQLRELSPAQYNQLVYRLAWNHVDDIGE